METTISRSERKVFSPHTELFGNLGRRRRSRCAVIVAHPNDEIVGGGCLISKLTDVQVLHISNGAPPSPSETLAPGLESVEEYAEQRRKECFAALEMASVPSDRVFDLDVPQLKAPYRLVEITKEVLRFLQKTSPQIILTHAYEGGHPDHDATAFAAHIAVRLLTENGLKAPVVFEFALYPGNKGLSKVPEFLHSPARESTTLTLDRDAQDLKLRMFGCFKTHRQIFDVSPLGPERFRKAPVYDFAVPPRGDKLYYENFDWGMTGEEWSTLASEALAQLSPSSMRGSQSRRLN